MKNLYIIITTILTFYNVSAQNSIPLDLKHWDINAKNHQFEFYKGKNALLIDQGLAILKDSTFRNGTIEFDVFISEERSFPGIRFRITDSLNMESFYLRSHLSGKPDGNQAAPVINGITAWQFYFGPAYSSPTEYKYDDWNHVKMVINESKAQVFFNYNKDAQLCWNLVHTPKEGQIAIGGSFAPAYYADIKINKNLTDIKNFKVEERQPVEGIINKWTISDKFEESKLNDILNISETIKERSWNKRIYVEEKTAANISREVVLNDDNPGNTVFARLTIDSDKDMMKLFDFGYSDRVVVILNGVPIYKGNNKWQSRDYRYLGTIGIFDSVYLPLKKGENTLLLAVSEDFGGWLITGRFENYDGIAIK
ncbi:hypothetical protein [Marinigracilibium pacificum]|uniref:3-keto-disaccharide hydrolase domain-containing protein n=1 Tax=Marinigracilibium pacificum TaxID=2729599 RepID=A0A848J8E3_9BACT|nr:hypothetical protein [Marinigracilibium pacificum]NMM50694.1 hypothetical protein [Marinigracilibium pacificum]